MMSSEILTYRSTRVPEKMPGAPCKNSLPLRTSAAAMSTLRLT